MVSFSGTTSHTIDTKARLCLPQNRRDKLGDSFVLSWSNDFRTLAIFTNEAWEKRTELLLSVGSEWDGMAHEFKRTVLGMAFEDTRPDNQGRILIPSVARKQFGLCEGDEVLLVGAGTSLEIWNAKRFEERFDTAPDPRYEKLLDYMKANYFSVRVQSDGQ